MDIMHQLIKSDESEANNKRPRKKRDTLYKWNAIWAKAKRKFVLANVITPSGEHAHYSDESALLLEEHWAPIFDAKQQVPLEDGTEYISSQQKRVPQPHVHQGGLRAGAGWPPFRCMVQCHPAHTDRPGWSRLRLAPAAPLASFL